MAFAFDSLDARPVTSESLKGKPSVLAFVTTWDLPSQAQVAFLSAMAKSDGAHAPSVDGASDKANYVVIALDGGKNRELVEVYAKALQVPFPVAHADADTIAGKGAFGDLQVPTVIIVDEFSIPTFRKSGVSKPDEIRAVLRSIGQRNRLRGPE